MMASAALAQSSYRIAKSWQYQEKLPDAFSENDISNGNYNATAFHNYGNVQDNQI